MVKLRFLIAATAAALVFAVPAGASREHGVTKHDRDVIRFFQHHHRLAATAAGGRVLALLLPRVTAELRRLQDARVAAPPPVAHLLLWKCIAGYPGFRPGGGSGESGGSTSASNGSHFNILQMTDPWGSHNFHPIGQSADAVMLAAEDGYAASGYSHTWLIEQWGQTIDPCWGYA